METITSVRGGIRVIAGTALFLAASTPGIAGIPYPWDLRDDLVEVFGASIAAQGNAALAEIRANWRVRPLPMPAYTPDD